MELALWEWGQGLVAEPVFAPVMKSRDTLSLVPPAGIAGAMVGVEGVAFVVGVRRVGSGTDTISHPASKEVDVLKAQTRDLHEVLQQINDRLDELEKK